MNHRHHYNTRNPCIRDLFYTDRSCLNLSGYRSQTTSVLIRGVNSVIHSLVGVSTVASCGYFFLLPRSLTSAGSFTDRSFFLFIALLRSCLCTRRERPLLPQLQTRAVCHRKPTEGESCQGCSGFGPPMTTMTATAVGRKL